MSRVPKRQHTVNVKEPTPRADPGARTPAGDAFSGLVVRVFRLNGLLAAEGDALARPVGQSSARWQLLAMVEGSPHTVAETARTLGLARQSVQRVADVLESDGLIRYEDNPRHRRARLVTLTASGKAALERIQAAQRPWADSLGARVGERELVRTNRILDLALEELSVRRAR